MRDTLEAQAQDKKARASVKRRKLTGLQSFETTLSQGGPTWTKFTKHTGVPNSASHRSKRGGHAVGLCCGW